MNSAGYMCVWRLKRNKNHVLRPSRKDADWNTGNQLKGARFTTSKWKSLWQTQCLIPVIFYFILSWSLPNLPFPCNFSVLGLKCWNHSRKLCSKHWINWELTSTSFCNQGMLHHITKLHSLSNLHKWCD